ncbi:hypothetical protein OQA88_8101 [Cercophora sp. LCS_1]
MRVHRSQKDARELLERQADTLKQGAEQTARQHVQHQLRIEQLEAEKREQKHRHREELDAIKARLDVRAKDVEILELRHANEVAFRERIIKEMEELHQQDLERAGRDLEQHYLEQLEARDSRYQNILVEFQRLGIRVANREQDLTQEAKRHSRRLEDLERRKQELLQENEQKAKQVEELEEKNEQLAQTRSCKICFEEAVNPVVLLPCGHGLLCQVRCWEAAVQARPGKICPVCRQSVTNSYRVFI